MARKKQDTDSTWDAARDAYLLGATLKDIAAQYSLSYEALKKRAERQRWPKPKDVTSLPPANTSPSSPAVVAGQSLERRGLIHRERIASAVEQAFEGLIPPALNNWSDIAIAVKLGNQAFGLDKPEGSIVSINFPATSSSEAPAYIDISTNFPSDTTNAIEAGAAGEDRQ